MAGPSSSAEQAHEAGANGRSAAVAEDAARRLIERALGHLGAPLAHTRVVAEVRVDRARFLFRRAVWRAEGAVLAWVAMVVLVGCGIVIAAVGLARLMQAVFADRAELGELVAGVLILAAAVAWRRGRMVLAERAEIRSCGAKHEAKQDVMHEDLEQTDGPFAGRASTPSEAEERR